MKLMYYADYIAMNSYFNLNNEPIIAIAWNKIIQNIELLVMKKGKNSLTF